MTKEILTKEQIKNELDRGRRRILPFSVASFLLCFVLAGVGVASIVAFACDRWESELLLYVGIITFSVITLIGLYGMCVVGRDIFEILFGKWRSLDIVITRDEVSRMVAEETERRRSNRGYYPSYDKNVLYFYRCGRYVANSTVFGYTSVGDEFYIVSYSGDSNKPACIYSTKIYEIKE